MAAGSKTAEIRAGVVVLTGLVILAIGLFLVTGGWSRWFEMKKELTILFKDSGTIGSGANVYRAGLRVGEVKGLETIERVIKGERYSVAFTIEVFKGTNIPIDSTFQISKSITNVVAFNIRPGVDKTLANEDTDNLVGERLASTDELVDRYTKLADQVSGVVDHADQLVLDLDAKVKEVDIQGMQGESRQLITDLRAAVEDFRALLRDNRERIDSIFRNVDDVSGAFKGDWTTMSGKVQGILDNTQEATGDLKGILRENRERVKSMLQGLDDGARRIAPVLAQMEAIGRAANDAVVELRPGLTRTISSASKAMEGFQAAVEDIRTAPWKLVNKPSGDESDDVHLYNAARNYVDAAGRVAVAVQDLETLRRLGVIDDPGRADLVEKTLTTMQEALAEFDANQKRFTSLITKTADK